jgi:lysyl-tRNA synthetase class 1
MIDNNSWPFLQAKRILDSIEYKIPNKGFVLFETGYGPSGLPHIGTFGEVLRTTYVVNAFKKIAPNIPVKLFVVSDDFDGMRKIPDNIPNKDMLKQHIGKPLTTVPDPFGVAESYGHNMNQRLRKFLDSFSFEYEFISSSRMYKEGKYNETLKLFAQNNDKLSQFLLPFFQEERASTYSIFMPIDPDSGIFMQDSVQSIDSENFTVTYKTKNGEYKTQSILDGKCKLQWKCDFPMRWIALDVNYEIYGKDVFTNENLYHGVCDILNKKKPINMFYELFLDESGKKISKSKGNGLTIEQWLSYANKESLSYYMYLKPQTAKRLHFDVIPKAVDEYISCLEKFHQQSNEQKIENPVYHIHNSNIPDHINYNISYAMLLNLASVCNPENEDILWQFITKYDSAIQKNDTFFSQLVKGSINYYYDFIKPNKKYKNISEMDNQYVSAIEELLDNLKSKNYNTAEEIQQLSYNIATKFNLNTKEWFSTLYQFLLGSQNGPRFGSFIQIYGLDNSIQLITQRLYENNPI